MQTGFIRFCCFPSAENFLIDIYFVLKIEALQSQPERRKRKRQRSEQTNFCLKRCQYPSNMTETGPADTGDAQQLDKFLDNFVANHRDDNWLSIKYGNYFVNHHEFSGEVVDWTIQYLQYM